MRHSLYQTLLPPEYSRIWAARHIGELNFDILQTVLEIGLHERPWNHGNTRHAQLTCLTFRGVALLAYAVDGWGVPPLQRDPAQWVPLWPVQSLPGSHRPGPATILASGWPLSALRHGCSFPMCPDSNATLMGRR